jgi:hypothetical protein
MENIEEKTISLQDLQNVLYKMDFYKRKNGYIAHDLSGRLCFFDSEPSFGGAYVTRQDILNYINQY